MALNETIEQIKNFDVNDVDFNRIGVWPLPARIFVLILLVALVMGLTFYLKISDLHDQLAQVTAKEVTLRKTFEARSFEAANLEAYRAQMQEMDATFNSLLSRLPSKSEQPGLLDDISTRARESGLTINSVAISDEKAAEFYNEISIKINVEGGYHDLGGFISGVAAMPRIVTLHDYSIVKKKGSGVLQMNITAKTYRYKAKEN